MPSFFWRPTARRRVVVITASLLPVFAKTLSCGCNLLHSHSHPTQCSHHFIGRYYRGLGFGPAARNQKQSIARPKQPLTHFTSCLPFTDLTRHIITTRDTSSSTRLPLGGGYSYHAHMPLHSQQLPAGGPPVVMESLKLRFEEEREYYSVIAALPGVQKQGICVDIVVLFICTRISFMWSMASVVDGSVYAAPFHGHTPRQYPLLTSPVSFSDPSTHQCRRSLPYGSLILTVPFSPSHQPKQSEHDADSSLAFTIPPPFIPTSNRRPPRPRRLPYPLHHRPTPSHPQWHQQQQQRSHSSYRPDQPQVHPPQIRESEGHARRLNRWRIIYSSV